MTKGSWQKTLALKARDLSVWYSGVNILGALKVCQVKKLLAVITLVACCCIGAVAYYLINFKNPLVCTTQQSTVIRDSVCQQFTNGGVHGDFCPYFCGNGGGTPIITPISCDVYHSNKEVVFQALIGRGGEGDDTSAPAVYVKGFNAAADSASTPRPDLIPLRSAAGALPSRSDFVQMVTAYLSDNVGIKVAEDQVIQRLFPDVAETKWAADESADVTAAATMENMWSLVQDDEFVFLRFYSADVDVFPKLHGRCGNIYVVEDLQPLIKAQTALQADGSFMGFAKRAALALAVLDFVDELETVFDEPLHLCDVKPEHFGISSRGRVKFLDLDTVAFKSVIGKVIGAGQELDEKGLEVGGGGVCSQHSDCNHFDCFGECDYLTGKCKSSVVNNNLQMVCQKIFSSRRRRGLLSYSGGGAGLLVSKHASRRVVRALQQCANPTGSKDPQVRVAASSKDKTELYKALEEVISFSHQKSR